MIKLNSLNQQILRTDVSGMPLEWVAYQDAVRLYFNDQIAYTCGSNIMTIRGGINAITNLRSKVDVNSIIATFGNNKALSEQYAPPLNNTTLFKRDDHLCLYCGNKFKTEATKIEKEIYKITGKQFNIGSPKQLGEILFINMKIKMDANITVMMVTKKNKHNISSYFFYYRGKCS